MVLARLTSLLASTSLLLLASAIPAAAQASPAENNPHAASEPASPNQADAAASVPDAATVAADPGAAVEVDSEPPQAPPSRLSAKSDINRIGQRNIGHGINVYSPEKERAMGESISNNIDQHTKLISDPDVLAYVNRLAQKIGRNSDTRFLITVKVIDSDDVNIFSLPGGIIYLDKGLLTTLDSEAELAGLMAHEIAHVASRHATHAMTRQYAFQSISLPLLYLGPISFPIQYLAIPLSNRKFDRDAEREADLLGMEYTYVSGYDPGAFVQALEKLNGLEARRRQAYTKLPFYKQFLHVPFHGPLTHAISRKPDMESRIRSLQKEIPELLPEASEYVVDTNDFQEAQDRLNWTSRPMFRRHTDAESAEKKDRPKLRDMIPMTKPNQVAFR